MTLQEIGNELVAGCRENRDTDNLGKLYAEDAVSVEAMTMPGMESRETHGLDGIRGKHEWWNNAMEAHSFEVSGPYFHGDDRFAVTFRVDATDRNSGERTQMEEVGVYHVANGKIVREEFFYTAG